MSSKTISKILDSGKPSSVGKIGFSEMKVLYSTLSSQPLTQSDFHDIFVVAGVFPPTQEALISFVEEMRRDLPEVDVLSEMGIDSKRELSVIDYYTYNPEIIALRDIEPYYWENPWSLSLEDKKVLIISPFTETINNQYLKRSYIWEKDILPHMELNFIKCPTSHYLKESEFISWIDCLYNIKDQMKQIDFDVCLIGAGAWSLPLAVEAKRLGKIGIHMGGPLQILFGIKGARWDEHEDISKMYNEYWVRPSQEETPEGCKLVEGGCYW